MNRRITATSVARGKKKKERITTALKSAHPKYLFILMAKTAL
jgi:hypothetical protein